LAAQLQVLVRVLRCAVLATLRTKVIFGSAAQTLSRPALSRLGSDSTQRVSHVASFFAFINSLFYFLGKKIMAAQMIIESETLLDKKKKK
jgi:hypothetical protein